MQEIKFRMYHENVGMVEIEGIMTDENTDKLDISYIGGRGLFDKKNIHIMQFTGLFDRNGKKIYIGDLVYFEYEDDEILYEVLINDFSQIPVIDSDIGQEMLHKCHNNVRVAGNIHEGFTM